MFKKFIGRGNQKKPIGHDKGFKPIHHLLQTKQV